MKILFINGSPNENGNTANLASILLNGKEYETLNLTNLTIGSYGQTLPYDGLDRVIEKMEEADTIVIGSPLYWHNICGSVRNVLDRFYGKVDESEFLGRKLYFVFQGAAPEKWMLDAGEFNFYVKLYVVFFSLVKNKHHLIFIFIDSELINLTGNSFHATTINALSQSRNAKFNISKNHIAIFFRTACFRLYLFYIVKR